MQSDHHRDVSPEYRGDLMIVIPRFVVIAHRAYSYLRFSTPEQAQGDSHRRQTALAEEYARKRGLELDTTLSFQDLRVSAFRGKNAEEGQLGAFLRAVQTGLVPEGSYLLVESLDRISRQSARRARTTLNLIVDEGITVVTLVDGKEYTAASLDEDPTSLLMSILVFMRAHEESVMKASRLSHAWAGKRTKAAKGERMTSMLPAWLTSEGPEAPVKLIPERAKIVQRIFTAYASGKAGMVGIAKALNRDGVPTFESRNGRKGNQWFASYIQRILKSPAAMGAYQPHTTSYKGRSRKRTAVGEPIKGYFPAAVDEDLFLKVQAMLSDTASPLRGKEKADLQNLFGGLAVCARCAEEGRAGGTMKRKPMARKLKNGERKLYVYFVCFNAVNGSGCTAKTINYEAVEECFLTHAPALLATAPIATGDAALEEKLRSTEAALDALEEHRVKLRDLMLETGSRSMAGDLLATEAELESAKAERDALVAKLEGASGPLFAGRVAEVAEALRAEPLDRKRVNAQLRSVLSRVVLDTAKLTGTLVWKHGGESEFIFGFPLD